MSNLLQKQLKDVSIHSAYIKPGGAIGLIANQLPVTNLIFEGGGPKGLVYIGAVNTLEQKGILSKIKHVGGSSAGAMTALAVGLGYSAAEIKSIINDANISDFMDLSTKPHTGFFSKFYAIGNTIENLVFSSGQRGRGIYLGDKLQQWVKTTIIDRIKTVEPGFDDETVTFKQLKKLGDKYPALQLKTMCFTGTNYTDQKLEVFSYHNTPNMQVDLAVRISMSLPWVFKSVKYHGKEYMDGGVLNNYPMFIFDKAPYFTPGYKLITGAAGQNLQTLGLKVDSDEEIKKLLWDGAKKDTTGWWASFKNKVTNSIMDIAAGAPNTSAEKANNKAIFGKYAERTIQIPDLSYSTYNFDLTDADKTKLADAGTKATEEWCNLYYENTGIELEFKDLEEMKLYMEPETIQYIGKQLGLINA